MRLRLLQSSSVAVSQSRSIECGMVHSVPSPAFATISIGFIHFALSGPRIKAHTFGLRRGEQGKAGFRSRSRNSAAVLLSNAEPPEERHSASEQKHEHRPAVILPGLGNNSADYASLVDCLQARGIATTVAEVSRPDWLRNAAGLLDGNYWRGTLSPRPVLDWYLERIRSAIGLAKKNSTRERVSILGHSAGGWLARVYMAEFGTSDIALLLTLGTPHLPPPKGEPGVFDQTRGLLYYVEDACPGAFHKPDVSYVCIAGRYLKGGKFFQTKDLKLATTGVGALTASDPKLMTTALGSEIVNAEVKAKTSSTSFRERIIGQAYKQVCGYSDVWGDGVVPEISAHLDGAINRTLDGVYHSPVGSSDIERPWYGSPSILEQWVHHLLD